MIETENINDSFIVYGSMMEAGEGLNDVQFKEYFLGMADFALDRIDNRSDDPMVSMLVDMAKPYFVKAQNNKRLKIDENEKKEERL